jgi:hypothetical protein
LRFGNQRRLEQIKFCRGRFRKILLVLAQLFFHKFCGFILEQIKNKKRHEKYGPCRLGEAPKNGGPDPAKSDQGGADGSGQEKFGQWFHRHVSVNRVEKNSPVVPIIALQFLPFAILSLLLRSGYSTGRAEACFQPEGMRSRGFLVWHSPEGMTVLDSATMEAQPQK